MPIKVHCDLVDLAEDQFKRVAYTVTGIGYTLHNEYGSLFWEKQSVEDEFISTTLTLDDRRQFTCDTSHWNAINSESQRLHDLLLQILADWGCNLQLPLYYDALTHFFGGIDSVIQDIPVIRDGVQVTQQRAHLITPDTAFKITALGDVDVMHTHLQRFVRHTSLRYIQWINLHQNNVTLTTISSTYSCP